MEPHIVEPTSRRFASQGLTLHCLDWGNKGAPPIILLHGTRDHARSWDRTARTLRDRWHVLALDLRGHGDSDWSPDGAYMSPYHVIDLAELIDTLECDKVTLVGHSFGGNTSWRYAGLFPERVAKLAIVDGLGPTPSTYAEWLATGPLPRTRVWMNQRRDRSATTSRRFATIEEAASRLRAGNPRLPEAQAHHLALHGVRSREEGFGWKFDPRVNMFAPEDFCIEGPEFWRAVIAPTLICYGSESWNTDPEKDGRATYFRDRRTVAIEGAGHWPHHERFSAFIETLEDFLSA
jgi:pimeloyl-ACP methyl ester carboxylesterase